MEIPPEGRVVHLGLSSQNGDAEYWATKDDRGAARGVGEKGMGDYQQCCGVERAQSFALRAFLRLEVYRVQTGVSWDEANPPGGHPPLLGSSPLSQLRNS